MGNLAYLAGKDCSNLSGESNKYSFWSVLIQGDQKFENGILGALCQDVTAYCHNYKHAYEQFQDGTLLEVPAKKQLFLQSV